MAEPSKYDRSFNHLTTRWSRTPSLDYKVVDQAGRLYAHAVNDQEIKLGLLRLTQDSDLFRKLVDKLSHQNAAFEKPIVIEATPGSKISAADWLSVEVKLISSICRQALSGPASASVNMAIKALSELSEKSLVVPEHSFGTVAQHIDNSCAEDPESGMTEQRSSEFCAFLFVALTPVLYAFTTYVLSDSENSENYELARFAFGVCVPFILSVTLVRFAKVLEPYVHRSVALLNSISDTWDAVLAMRTPADCLLVAQLYQTLCEPCNRYVTVAGLSPRQACLLVFAAPNDQNRILALLTADSGLAKTGMRVPTGFSLQHIETDYGKLPGR